MKNQNKNELLLIVALGKSFNGTPLNKKECDLICNMKISELVLELEINETQASLLHKWACSCKEGFVFNEEDNC